jgi:hypothetical protein
MLENKNGNTTQFGQFYGINIDPEKGTIAASTQPYGFGVPS